MFCSHTINELDTYLSRGQQVDMICQVQYKCNTLNKSFSLTSDTEK